MTRTELESFLAVVQAGSLSAAARSLYITQPALSRRIQSLEQENDADAPGGAVCITGHKVDGDLERSTGNTGPTQQKELYHRLQ